MGKKILELISLGGIIFSMEWFFIIFKIAVFY